jgi:sulfite oxidase
VLSLADLQQRFAPRTEVATLVCAGNRRAELLAVRDIPGQVPWGPATISTAVWNGVSLADVLAEAGPCSGAAHVAFTAEDVSPSVSAPYGSSIPLSKACSGEVLLAWGMNREALPRVHGGPVRVVTPGYIGARSVKWVQRMNVQARPSESHYQAGTTGCCRPTPHPARPRHLPGAADHDLRDPPSRRWRPRGRRPHRRHRVRVRAWDDSGATQPEFPASLWNPAGYDNTSWPRIRVDVR